MTTNLNGRSFVKELDFTTEEWLSLLDLAQQLKREHRHGACPCPAAGRGQRRRHLREGLHAHPMRLRGRGPPPGRARHLPRPLRLAHGPQGVGEGLRPRPRPDVRRDRVPRLLPGHRRDAGPVLRRTGVERPDRRVAPDPVAVRHAHDARARQQARQRDRVRLHRRRAQQRRQLAADRRRDDGHGRANGRADVTVQPARR